MIIARIISLLLFFLKEVVLANLQIARLVFWNPLKIKPAFIEVPLDIKSDYGIFFLSSMITLTPGTLSIEVSKEKTILFVHVTHAEDPEAVVRSIKNGFERRLREVGC